MYSVYGWTAEGILLSSIVLFFIFMVVWCGVKATFTDPGLVVDPIVSSRRCSYVQTVSEEAKKYYKQEESYNYCV